MVALMKGRDMSSDDANTSHDQLADGLEADSPPQIGGGSSLSQEVADPVSRRRFLRAAVIGGAGVAGGVTALGALAASGNLPGAIPVKQVFADTSFHDGDCEMCVTSSSGADNVLVGDDPNEDEVSEETDAGFTINNGKAQNPGDFYIFFTAPNLPPGTYHMTFTPDPGFSTKGTNPYNRYIYAAGAASECPGTVGGSGEITGATQTNGSSLAAIFPYTNSGPGNVDLQLGVHMDYTGGDIGTSGTTKTFTFSAALTKDGQATAVCSSTVTVTGTQK
jgi:hypothetical protein